MIRTCTLLLALSSCLALPAMAADTVAAPLPNTTVDHVDLQRYAGTWYEQASLPMVFTRACTSDTTALYTPREDGMIDVRNRCRTEDGSFNQVDGEARKVGDSTSQLEVRFAPGWLSWLPMVWGDYWIVDLDKDYQWSLVGSPKQDYLWILSREPQLDSATYDRLVDKARRMGYPVDKLQRTPQSAQH
jgi:apolipoprotein D and lipocalin family protein